MHLCWQRYPVLLAAVLSLPTIGESQEPTIICMGYDKTWTDYGNWIYYSGAEGWCRSKNLNSYHGCYSSYLQTCDSGSMWGRDVSTGCEVAMCAVGALKTACSLASDHPNSCEPATGTCPCFVYYSPSIQPSGQPSNQPTGQPLSQPTGRPSSQPTGRPSGQPSNQPTGRPSSQPTGRPSGQPSHQPTGRPSSQPTSQPTAQPTSTPTSKPTRKRGPRKASLLTGDVNAAFVWFKINYFLAVYVGYFAVLNLVSYLVNFFELGNETVDGLTQGAFASEHYRHLATVDEAAKPGSGGMRSLLLWRIVAADEERIVKDRQQEEAETGCVESGKAGYSSEFYRFLLAKRTYIGCKPDLFPHGYVLHLFSVDTRGLLEDLIVYTMNYHKILSTMFAIKGSPHYSRLDHGVVFTMQHVMCLSVLALVDDIFSAAGVPSDRAGLFTLLVIPTLSIGLNVLFRAIVMSKTMRRQGRPFLLVIFAIGAMCILVFAAMATSTAGRFDLITSYTVKVFVVSSLQELLLILLLFYHRMYFAVYIGRFPLLMVGRYFLERLLLNSSGKEASGDVVCKTYSLFDLVTVEWAYSSTQTLMAAAAAAALKAQASVSIALAYGLSGDRIDEFQMISFTDNPLNNRAAADLLRVSTAAATSNCSSAGDSAPQHTARLTAAHVLAVNPLLLPRPTRTYTIAQTAVEETGDGGAATRSSRVSLAMHESGEESDETLSLQLKRFALPVAKQFQEKVHFFQALEQGAIDRRGANVESTDMEMIEQMGGAAVELQGELVGRDSLADTP